jgi:hypothetical protein
MTLVGVIALEEDLDRIIGEAIKLNADLKKKV